MYSFRISIVAIIGSSTTLMLVNFSYKYPKSYHIKRYDSRFMFDMLSTVLVPVLILETKIFWFQNYGSKWNSVPVVLMNSKDVSVL